MHSAEQMRKVLQRERARADRTGQEVSLATFTPRSRQALPATAACLLKILKGRLRSTDELGWLDEQRICVVFPNTGPRGAWTVVDDVGRMLPADVLPLRCQVYSYPSAPAGRGGGRELGAAEEDAGRPVAALEALLVQALPAWKRLLDVAGALTGLVLLLPLFAVIAVAVKVSSRGPVLFGQRRSGRGGRPFVMYKFRSMAVDAEARKAALLKLSEQDGPAFKLRNDPRVTALGRLLRRTSLDELPQLWNVLRGEMSLVGPRPLPCAETEACAGWLRGRLDVTPGLTCIWQVTGRSRVSFADWVRMDVRYIRSLSPWQDLKLLLCTVPAVLIGRGAR
jgi:lipopolysaccharide/colanic/teichoic acid biosynthesis glycosyltransferase